MADLPAELIEKILLNLPVKSLIRFSTVSKLWNSIILQPKLAQSYRGREIIVFNSLIRRNGDGSYKMDGPLACRLSSISSDDPTDGATPFDFPRGLFLASCGYLWLFAFEKSLLLYNPSIQTYRKLPDPEPVTGSGSGSDSDLFSYGLGYDSVSDDYKIVKIQKRRSYNCDFGEESDEIQMYSLRNNCWRKVKSQLPRFSNLLSRKGGLFVSGAIHWLITKRAFWSQYILSFDLSDEKFGLIELPELLPKERVFRSRCYDMIVFGGKLRVCVSCVDEDDDCCFFSVWVMEDYESKLWVKEMEFDHRHVPGLGWVNLTPFYSYDDTENLVRAVITLTQKEKMFVYKGEDGSSTPTFVEKNFGSNDFRIVDSYTYVESFVSPGMGALRRRMMMI